MGGMMINFTPVSQEELERLKNACEIPNIPTQMTYHLRRAVSGGGDYADEWEDKPHRLVYDACREIERLTVTNEALSELLDTVISALDMTKYEIEDVSEASYVSRAADKYFLQMLDILNSEDN
jgi:hypothetical protein